MSTEFIQKIRIKNAHTLNNVAPVSILVVKAKILSLDWEKDSKTTAPPTTTKAPTTKPMPTLPKPEDGETDFVVGRKPDSNLVSIFKNGKEVHVTETDILAEPAMLPFFFRPRYIRVQLEKLIKGRSYLPQEVGHEFNIRFTSMHRVPYVVGKTYLLTGFATGKELATNECNWFSEWDKVTPVMHRGIRRYYWIYCRCQIQNCFGGRCSKSPRKCPWDIEFSQVGFEKADFLSKNKVCMVTCGRCNWHDPRERATCTRG